MKKKALSRAFALLLAFLMVATSMVLPTVAAEDVHAHAETETATCPGVGVAHTLTNCTDYKVNAVVTPCGENSRGYTQYECNVCHDTFLADVVEDLTASCVFEEANKKAATCEDPATYDLICKYCGIKKNSAPIESEPALGHTLKITQDGTKHYCTRNIATKCSLYGEGKAVAHTLEIGDIVAPTAPGNGAAGKDGSFVMSCVCGYTDEYTVSSVCTTANGEHTLEKMSGKAATCTAEGYSAYVRCKVCLREFYKTVLPKTEHTFPKAINGLTGVELKKDANGLCEKYVLTCTTCNTEKKEVAAEHITYLGTAVAPNCKNEGYTPVICCVCNKTVDKVEKLDALGHKYTKADGSINWKNNTAPVCGGAAGTKVCVNADCSGTGYEVEVKVEHILDHFEYKYVDNDLKPVVNGNPCANITVRYSVCKTCKATYGGNTSADQTPALNHRNAVDNHKEPANCQLPERTGKWCPDCKTFIGTPTTTPGSTKTDVHDKLGAWTVKTAAQCLFDGVEEQHCSVCNALNGETRVLAHKGHTMGALKIDKQADCLNGGEATKTCSVCNYAASYKFVLNDKNNNNKQDSGEYYTKASVKEIDKEFFTAEDIAKITVKGHDWSDKWNLSTGVANTDYKLVAATCQATGYKAAICEVCDAVATSGTTGYYQAIAKDTTPAGHTGATKSGTATAPAACGHGSKQNYYCQDCGAKWTITSDDATATPTYTTITFANIDTYVCAADLSDEEYILIAKGNLYICDTCAVFREGDTKKVPEVFTGKIHELEDVKEKAATCDADGYAAYKQCKNCDYNTKVVTLATSHTLEVSHSTNVAAECDTVGYDYVKCTACDTLFAFDWVNPTGHKLANGKIFTDCSGLKKDEKCVTCGYGHDIKATATKHMCIGTSTVRTFCENCDFSETAPHKCDANCPVVRDHAWGDEFLKVAPTYTTFGEKGHTCSLCGEYEATNTEVPKLSIANTVMDVTYTISHANENLELTDGKVVDGGLMAITFKLKATNLKLNNVLLSFTYDALNAEFVSGKLDNVTLFDENGSAFNATEAKAAYDAAGNAKPRPSTVFALVSTKELADATVNGEVAFVTLYFRVMTPALEAGITFTPVISGERCCEATNAAGTTLTVNYGTAIKVGSNADITNADVAVAVNKLGDLTSDGRTAPADLTAMLNAISNGASSTVADIDRDGKVSLSDLALLRSYLGGAISYEEMVASK